MQAFFLLQFACKSDGASCHRPFLADCLRRPLLRLRQLDEKCGTLPGLGLHPNASPVPLDDAPRYRQADAGSGIGIIVNPLESREYAGCEARIDTDSVIAN